MVCCLRSSLDPYFFCLLFSCWKTFLWTPDFSSSASDKATDTSSFFQPLWVLCSKTNVQSSGYTQLQISPFDFLNFYLCFSSFSPTVFPTHRLSWSQSVFEQNVCSPLLSICSHQLLAHSQHINPVATYLERVFRSSHSPTQLLP